MDAILSFLKPVVSELPSFVLWVSRDDVCVLRACYGGVTGCYILKSGDRRFPGRYESALWVRVLRVLRVRRALERIHRIFRL